MSVFGPNQVEELIILDGANVGTSVVKASKTDTAVDTEGEKFRFIQEEGDVLLTQFSDVIDPSKVNDVILKEYEAPRLKKVTVGAIESATLVKNATYILEIRILEESGALSSENFAVVSGYYQTGESDTAETVANALVDNVNANLERRGGKELTVATTGTAGSQNITVEAKEQAVVAGKDDGRPIRFDVNHKIYTVGDPISKNVNNVAITINEPGYPGAGTGKYAVNLEWFTKGYKYPHYRQTGYPADFGDRIPYFASQNKTYNVIHVKAYSDRQSPTVEKQQKVFTILVERTDLASNGDTNTVLGKLRTVLGSGKVPADLDITE